MSLQNESAQVVAVKQRYLASFAEKAAVVLSFKDRLAEGEDNADVLLQECYDYLHKLAGSSGMYGFDGVAKHCRKALALVKENNHKELEKRLQKIHNQLSKHID